MDTHNRLNEIKRRLESGYTVTFQAILYIFLLFTFLAFVYDFGYAGYMTAIATASMRAAAQDAAKNIDVNLFLNDQVIRLADDATDRARQVASDTSGGKVQVLSAEVRSLPTRDIIVVTGHVDVDLHLLGSIFGFKTIIIPVEAFAEPAYGADIEGQ
jgi:hypothetical protein